MSDCRVPIPPGGFLLKRVQHIDSICKTDGVNRSVRIPVVVFDNLQDSWALAFPGLSRGVFSSVLGCTQSETHAPPNINGKTANVLQR